ncbi:MAG: glycosyltransferase [Candidatus Omnitrophica bacterium]|nr:glycosyltransferase [Candidatus Omnitrophota bacterium]
MDKIFSLILPTRQRPRLVKNLVKSIVETTAQVDGLELVLCLDEDDDITEGICACFLSTHIVRSKNDTMGNITRKSFEKCSGRFMMLVNDDMIFRSKQWDIKVLEAFSRFPDGVAMAWGNDLYYGKMMSCFPILPRKACELMDNICPAQYRRHCIDPHIYDIFERLDRLGHQRSVYLPQVVFEHMNYNLGILLNGRGSLKDNDHDDQEVYLSLADYRQNIAQKMADYINACAVHAKK